MSADRPTGITAVCVLAAIGGLIDLFTAQPNVGSYEVVREMESDPTGSKFAPLYLYGHAGITLLSSYFMLQAKNWARWLYLLWNAVRIALAFGVGALPWAEANVGFLAFRGGMIPGMIFFVAAMWLLCRRDAREYFARGGRAWWRE